MGLHAYLLTVGREILVGRTLDTNAHWLAGEITRLGGTILKISCVDDHPQAIGAEVRSARRHGSDVLVTTGGLGPTPDDVTLEGIAAAAGRRLRLSRAARTLIEERYRVLHAQGRISDPALNPARLKMARLPTGTTPLPNPIGTAPGAYLTWGRLHIFALPGVPAEMKALFAHEVNPRIEALSCAAGSGTWVEMRVPTGMNDESTLAPVLAALRRAFPDVYAKSHPSGFGVAVDLIVTVAVRGSGGRAARERASAARAYLLNRLSVCARSGGPRRPRRSSAS